MTTGTKDQSVYEVKWRIELLPGRKRELEGGIVLGLKKEALQ